jgi:excisionase family DNA binding protein
VKLEELEEWLTPGDAAEVIGVSRQWIHKLLEERRLRSVKTRAGWLIDPADAERVAAERRNSVQAPSRPPRKGE